MDQAKKSIIFKIIATAAVSVYGVAVAVLMAIMIKESKEPAQIYICGGMIAASIAALIFIWWPRKKKV